MLFVFIAFAKVTDRCGNRTAYEYDEAGRTTKVTSQDANGTDIAHVSYAYDPFDNLTHIARGDDMGYVLTYNAYHNLQSIGVEGKEDGDLVTYTHKNGNGHVMRASYNTAGQMVAEKWYENNTATQPIAHYKYVYDGQGSIVRSIDMTAKIEYTYTYEEGKISRAAQCAITGTNLEIAYINPFRYRSYTYDQEIGMYYLQSRYYDPDTGRFVNADNVSLVGFVLNGKRAGENNLYSYCNNSVVSTKDASGYIALDVIVLVLGAIYGAFLGLVGWVLSKSIDFLIEVIQKKKHFPITLIT